MGEEAWSRIDLRILALAMTGSMVVSPDCRDGQEWIWDLLTLRSLWTWLSRSGGQRDGNYVGVWVGIGGMGVEETTEGRGPRGFVCPEDPNV